MSTTEIAPRVVFLPGAAGDGEFWRPVAERLPAMWEKVRLSWPGLGDQPHQPNVGSFDDLADLVAATLPRRSDLVAQSMGSIVALRVAANQPEKVRRLVLAATSGGVDLAREQAADWRAEYRLDYPSAAAWVTEQLPDLTQMIKLIASPTLLLWGDRDPTSPIAVGERLLQLLANATLAVIPGGTHSFAHDRADLVAGLIADHLR